MGRRILVSAVMLAMVLGGVAACGSDVEEAPGVALPERFPADVPVYEGEVTAAKEVQSDEGDSYIVDVTAPDDPGVVVDWYQEKFGAEGWTIVSATAPNEGSGVVTGEKDGQSVTVTVVGTDEGSDLTIDVVSLD